MTEMSYNNLPFLEHKIRFTVLVERNNVATPIRSVSCTYDHTFVYATQKDLPPTPITKHLIQQIEINYRNISLRKL